LNFPDYKNLLLSVLSGFLIGISYPSLPLGFLAWIGFIPLFIVLISCKNNYLFKYGYLAGITSHFITLYWIGLNSGAGFVPVFLSLIGAVFYLSLYWGLFTTILGILINIKPSFLWFSPLIWTSLEWIRSFGPLGFPWIDLALTQTRFLPLIQIMDVTGSSGVSFWIMTLNVLLFLFFNSKDSRKKYAVCAIGLIGLLWIFGLMKINSIENIPLNNSIQVAITQPNVDPNEKWERNNRESTFNLMHMLLDEAINMNPDLILWPETALPSYLRLSSSDRRPIQEKVDNYNIPLLSGTIDKQFSKGGFPLYFNGSIYLQPNKPSEVYHKVKLVPFAEYVPLSDFFPKLSELNFGQGNFTKGNEFTLFSIGDDYFSNLICYESSLPDVVRKFVMRGAKFLTIQANDGWLGNSSGPFQHFELAILRAVENRRSIVRSANTGISGVITPSGKVKVQKNIGERSVFIDSIPLFELNTFYTEHGNILGKLSSIMIVLSLGVLIWLKK
tara:strand:+ start:16800 stop:18299 length:1500 start_codon:yes stop_codon:yes gene_type:complete